MQGARGEIRPDFGLTTEKMVTKRSDGAPPPPRRWHVCTSEWGRGRAEGGAVVRRGARFRHLCSSALFPARRRRGAPERPSLPEPAGREGRKDVLGAGWRRTPGLACVRCGR